jgi:hypothetical protein
MGDNDQSKKLVSFTVLLDEETAKAVRRASAQIELDTGQKCTVADWLRSAIQAGLGK